MRQILLHMSATMLLLAAASSHAQDATTPEISPNELVREAVSHEIAAANNAAVKYMFLSRKQTPKGSQTRLYAETNDAMAGMLIAINDRPLTAQQQKAEMDHLEWLMNNPEQLRKKRAREKEDSDRTLRILKALPEAFLYEYDGTENGDAAVGREGDQLVRLKFVPNRNYSPPSRVEQVLAGMQGYVLIDENERRIAKIDGTLVRDVSFGWGIFGRLDKGGHFLVQQADVGAGNWEITLMSLKMTGRLLLFKSISMISAEVFSNFQRVSENLPFAQGVELLKREQEKLAHVSAPQSSEAVKQRQ